MNFIKIILSVFTLVVIIFVNNACGLDLADNPINNVKPIDTLENGLEMKIDGKEWKSNGIAKSQYVPNGLQFDASYYNSNTKIKETMTFILKYSNANMIFNFYLIDDSNITENFAFLRYFPFSTPRPTKNYNSYSGNLELTFRDTNRIKGTFALLLKDSIGTQLNITDGKFSIKFLKE